MDKMIVVDIDKCMSCHSCELACAVARSKSKNLIEAIYEKEKPVSRIILEEIESTTIPIHCRHCEDAPCVEVCPAGAITRPAPDSPVVLDSTKCIGCRACIIVCPFGVIRMGPDGKSVIKCNLCFDRLQMGQEPACAEACTTRAIRYISIEEYTAQKREEYVKKYKVAIMKGEEVGD
jgi:carbon-monoxide dehydrogenase iron sulfur subunit